VTLTVTDASGLTHTETTIASIPNIAPAIAAFPGATLLPGETYTASGSFADADPDTWTATVNYGDTGTGSRTATVTVLTAQAGIQALMGQVSRLNLPAVSTTALQAPLQAAVAALDSGNRTAATQQMEAFVLQVDALVRSGRASAAQGAALAGEANRILASVNR
jgi:hypothetical protein